MSRETALQFVEQGYRVFPVREDKSPLIKEWPKRATNDPRQARSLWDAYPSAGVGIVTGDGLVVVDLDVKNGVDGVGAFTDWTTEHGLDWSPTTTTRSGGQHVYYRASGQYGNRVNVLPGVDVRGENGYVVAYGAVPPLAELPTMSEPLARLLPSKDGKDDQGTAEASPREINVKAIPAAVEGELDTLEFAQEGQRNHQLNDAAFNLGEIVGDHLDEDEIRERLLETALKIGLEYDESVKTIESGLSGGKRHPRTVVEASVAEPGAWTPVDFAELRANGLEPIEPTFLARTDGQSLLYPGLTHSISGESGSGKSWLAQWATAEALHAGHGVLYLDYESSAQEIAQRLLILGCTWDQIDAALTYVNPDDAPTGAEFESLLSARYGLAVVDGVTEALGLSGLVGDNLTNSNDAVTKWHKMLPKRIAVETGAAVVQVDHVTKSKDGRGSYAIGGQAKRASITGASYVVQPRESFGRGRSGSFDLYVGKDRPGAVLAAHGGEDGASGRHIARVEVQSFEDRVRLELVPTGADQGDYLADMKVKLTTFLAELPEDHEGVTTNAIREGAGGKQERRKQALDELVDSGHVSRVMKGQRRLHKLLRPYVPDFDLL